MKYHVLRDEVCEANKEIGRVGLAALTWGNASQVDRENGVVAIKPSGVGYEALTPADIVLIDLASGNAIDGSLRPSSDTPTHLHLYRTFSGIGGVIHTHSHFATVWAQAQREIPCLGTTHADLFHGPVPLTRALTEEEVRSAYELNTGKVIVEHFAGHELDPEANPGVLVRGHGPFTWGGSAAAALKNAIALEEVAGMAYHSLTLRADPPPVPGYLLDKHFSRKHGAGAYYGQPGNGR